MFEHLQGSQLSASALALALGCSEDGTERLLNTCVSLELLTANTDPHGTGDALHTPHNHIQTERESVCVCVCVCVCERESECVCVCE